MATNQRYEGEVVPVVAGGTYVSGTPVRIASMFGVPVHAATSGQTVGLAVEGVWALPKTGGGGITFALGAPVYWDGSVCTATATDYFVGLCQLAAADADTTVNVLISGEARSPVILAGTATILAGQSAITASVPTAFNAKPVTVTVKGLTGGTGAFHATLPIVLKASVASGTLTITALDAISAAATAVASNVICYYVISAA